ncbi:MAG: endolytic transglycosylase MltG [Patescibacteria group bacterium]|nr:endolytic transglycosylase MltG [bacterium]MDZ4241182.1 endolytic transglycosylase MltG [Patescibacteria group bacterium]
MRFSFPDISKFFISTFLPAVRNVFNLFFLWIKRNDTALIKGAVAVVLTYALFYASFFSAPREFPAQAITTIEDGKTLNQVSMFFAEQNIIRSPFWLKVFVTVFGGDKRIYAGDYFFKDPSSVITVARRITSDDHGLTSTRMTIPEGLNVFEIADLVAKKFKKFDPEKFIAIAPEGYLFPDTYFFLQNVEAEFVVAAMKKNFDEKIQGIMPRIEEFGRPFEDVIIMASIIETEARQKNTRRMISDILWRRIDIGMPLQVDVSFKYVNGKVTPDLTLDDLEIDSPYNTYRYAGLPPTPIANPGLGAIEAAVTPIKSSYLYFLSGHDGVMHYARTFEEHKQNRRLYLDR